MHSADQIGPYQTLPHFDVIRMYVADDIIIPRGVIMAMTATCGDVVFKPIPMMYKSGTAWVEHHHWRQSLKIFQPTIKTFQILQDWLPDPSVYLITAAEVTLNFLVDNFDQAEKIQSFLESHLVMRWHGKHIQNPLDSGTYWRQRNQGKTPGQNMVIYKDSCKHTGKPAAHLEWKLYKSQTLRRHNIDSITDLINFDHLSFWQDKLVLYRIKPGHINKLGMALSNRHLGGNSSWIKKYSTSTKTITYNNFERIGNRTLQYCQIRPGVVSMQKLIDEFEKNFKIKRCLERFKIPLQDFYVPNLQTLIHRSRPS
jgi:hypothetical protein